MTIIDTIPENHQKLHMTIQIHCNITLYQNCTTCWLGSASTRW